MWDAGAVADHERSGGLGYEQRLLRRDGQERFVKLTPTLTSQLAAAGYKPSDVTHLALSHYHWDHTADANLFAGAQWLVTKTSTTRCSRPTARWYAARDLQRVQERPHHVDHG